MSRKLPNPPPEFSKPPAPKGPPKPDIFHRVRISDRLQLIDRDGLLYIYDYNMCTAIDIDREDCAKLASLLIRYIVSGTIE